MYRLKQVIFVLLAFSGLTGYSQTNQKSLFNYPDAIRKKIKMISFENKPFVVYENSLSIIYLDKNLIIDNLKKHLENNKLCDLRKENYNKILIRLSETDSSFYVIMPEKAPDSCYIYGDIPILDSIEVRKLLDLFSKNDTTYSSKDYIYPFGYKIKLDISQLAHLDMFYNWMLSELVLKGNAKIFNKQSGKYETQIFFHYIPVMHGIEELLLHDKRKLFDLKYYSDIIMPDCKCGENYKGHELIE